MSEYVYRPNKTNTFVCYPDGFQWRRNVTVSMVITGKTGLGSNPWLTFILVAGASPLSRCRLGAKSTKTAKNVVLAWPLSPKQRCPGDEVVLKSFSVKINWQYSKVRHWCTVTRLAYCYILVSLIRIPAIANRHLESGRDMFLGTRLENNFQEIALFGYAHSATTNSYPAISKSMCVLIAIALSSMIFAFDFFTVKNYGPWIKFLISQLAQVSYSRWAKKKKKHWLFVACSSSWIVTLTHEINVNLRLIQILSFNSFVWEFNTLS